MDQITSGLRKLLLAGIGAAAIAKEKGGEVLELLSKRGEVTVEQGKVLNEELKHNIKETLQKQTKKDASVEELLSSMTPDQIAALKELLSRKQAEAGEAAEADSKEEPEEKEEEKAEETSKAAESSEASASADE